MTYNLSPLATGSALLSNKSRLGQKTPQKTIDKVKEWWANHPEEDKRRRELCKVIGFGNKSRVGKGNKPESVLKWKINWVKAGRIKIILAYKTILDTPEVYIGYNDCARRIANNSKMSAYAERAAKKKQMFCGYSLREAVVGDIVKVGDESYPILKESKFGLQDLKNGTFKLI